MTGVNKRDLSSAAKSSEMPNFLSLGERKSVNFIWNQIKLNEIKLKPFDWIALNYIPYSPKIRAHIDHCPNSRNL